MSRKSFLATVAIALMVAGGLTVCSMSALESHEAPKSQATATPSTLPKAESKSATYLADLPVSMASIDVKKGVYYLGLGSGILTSWSYGAKSTSRDGSLNQEFVVNLNEHQLKEFQAMGGDVGSITERQGEILSYYAVIYSQRLVINELEAGHPKPNITFTAALKQR